ncbi:hypothetical protein FRC10_002426, partial [Ceratobasidium sp. 414]
PVGDKAPATTGRAEAVHCASAYLGTDASRYSNATLQKVVTQIEDPGKEVGLSPMEIEMGSALSSTGGIADAGLAQGTKEHNPPTPDLVLPADNSDTEPESEPKIVELGLGDSVSQRICLVPQTPPDSSHLTSAPAPVPHAPSGARKAKPSNNMHASSDTNTEDKSDTEPEDKTMCSLKRQQITPASQTNILPTCLGQSCSQCHQSLPQRDHSHPQQSSTLPVAPPSSKVRIPNTSSQSSSSHILQESLSVSDLGAVLGWASRFTKQASTLHHMTQAVDYQLLAMVLDNTRHSHLVTSAPEHIPLHPRHTAGLAGDSVTVLEAEAALALGTHTRPCHKSTLADFPGFPQQIATLAISDLIATAVASGVYESHETLSTMANKAPPLLGLSRGSAANRKFACVQSFCLNIVSTTHHERVKTCNTNILSRNFYQMRSTATRNLVTNVDPYEHEVLSCCIAAAFFWATDSLGMVFHDKFYLMPLPTVAMALTTTQHCISEWNTGHYILKELNIDTQRNMYEAHLTGLLNYGNV